MSDLLEKAMKGKSPLKIEEDNEEVIEKLTNVKDTLVIMKESIEKETGINIDVVEALLPEAIEDKLQLDKEEPKKNKLSLIETRTQKKKKKRLDPKRSIIIGLIGQQGSGKTTHSASFGKYGKVLYLDSEQKAHGIINEHFQEYDIDIISFRKTDARGRLDRLATARQFEGKTPEWKKMLESGNYAVCVIDKCSVFRPYCKYEWLRRNPDRQKPQSYEWGDIEEIVQDLLYPFITTCRDNNIILILTYDVKDLYLNNVVIGTEEDAKKWILGEMDYEFWLDLDYEVYCLKHKVKPFWFYRTEDRLISDYIFDKEFISEEAEMMSYQDFKENTLLSPLKRLEKKERKNKLELGK